VIERETEREREKQRDREIDTVTFRDIETAR